MICDNFVHEHAPLHAILLLEFVSCYEMHCIEWNKLANSNLFLPCHAYFAKSETLSTNCHFALMLSSYLYILGAWSVRKGPTCHTLTWDHAPPVSSPFPCVFLFVYFIFPAYSISGREHLSFSGKSSSGHSIYGNLPFLFNSVLGRF